MKSTGTTVCLIGFIAFACFGCNKSSTNLQEGSEFLTVNSGQIGAWSEQQHGLQGRLKVSYRMNAESLVADLKLELRNCSERVSPIAIFLEPEAVVCRIIDTETGNLLDSTSFQPRSGPSQSWGKLIIPASSLIALSLRCETVAQPRAKGIFVGLCNDDWFIEDLSREYSVNVSFGITESQEHEGWHGQLSTPSIRLRKYDAYQKKLSEKERGAIQRRL